MATYTLRRFTDPDVLKKISPQRLLTFLEKHRGYFAHRGVDLPANTSESFDYEALINVFMNPDKEAPSELNDGLYFVDEMSTEESADELLEELDLANQRIHDADPTPADIAIHAWLVNRDLLERKHAERYLIKAKKFEYFQSNDEAPTTFEPSTAMQLKALEDDLGEWFEKKKRGRSVRVFIYPRPDGVWFAVRHGELFKREGTLNGDKSEAIYFRPEKHDVLVYSPALNELRIHTCSPKEVILYKEKFGLHLFGNQNFFPGTKKYTLEPLKRYGQKALACGDIPGLESVALKEIRYYWPGPHPDTEIHRGPDLFAAWEGKTHGIPPKAHLVRCSLEMKFTETRAPRTIVIQPSNIAHYTRDDDASSVVEHFLREREFIIGKGGNVRGEIDAKRDLVRA